MLAVLALVAGLAVLVVAADRFVLGAEGMALRWRWSPAVIGAVVIGFGTSVPELVTSALAAAAGEPDLAIGNAAGSNVANLLLILGIATVVAPLVASGRGAWEGPVRDAALAGGAGVLLVAVSLDGRIGVLDAVVLLLALAGAIAWQITSGRTDGFDLPEVTGSRAALLLQVGLGLVGVIVGAQALVWGATRLAEQAGVPPIVVGTLVVAVGTSLPELATAIASARRGQSELLIGNLLGSNLFNALAVVGVAAIVADVRGDALLVDGPALGVVAAAAVVTGALGLWLAWRPAVARWGGVLLLGVYGAAVPLLLASS